MSTFTVDPKQHPSVARTLLKHGYRTFRMDCDHGFYVAPADHFEEDPFGPPTQRCATCAERHALWREEDKAQNELELRAHVHFSNNIVGWLEAKGVGHYNCGTNVTMGPYNFVIGRVQSAEVHHRDQATSYAQLTVVDMYGELWEGVAPTQMYITDREGTTVRIAVPLTRQNPRPMPVSRLPPASPRARESKE